MYNYLKKPPDTNIDRRLFNTSLKATKRFVTEHPELIITKADKGNTTVIAYKNDYLDKMETLFNDTQTYEVVTHKLRDGNVVDPCLSVSRVVN